MSRIFDIFSRVALTITFALTGITALYCYHAAVVLAEVPNAARELLDGYRTSVSDIWGLPLFGLFVIFAIWRSRRDARVTSILRDFDIPVFDIPSMKITFGGVIVYGPLAIMVVGIGLTAAISAARYEAFTKCYMEQTVPPSSN